MPLATFAILLVPSRKFTNGDAVGRTPAGKDWQDLHCFHAVIAQPFSSEEFTILGASARCGY